MQRAEDACLSTGAHKRTFQMAVHLRVYFARIARKVQEHFRGRHHHSGVRMFDTIFQQVLYNDNNNNNNKKKKHTQTKC
jgi:hypothetical protein